MSKVTSFGAKVGLTVLDSRAEMRVEERSCPVIVAVMRKWYLRQM